MLNDRKEIRNVWVPSQPEPLRIQIKSSVWYGTVFVSLNLSISGQEEVGFYSNSNIIDTHNPNTQGGLKPCMCM